MNEIDFDQPTSPRIGILPWCLTCLLATLAGLFLAGSLLAGLHLSMTLSLVISLPLCFLAGVIALHRFPARPLAPSRFGALLVLTLFIALGTLHRLWSPVWGPLVSTGGGDAGDHVFYTTRLLSDGVQQYNGLITFHLAAWLTQALSGANFATVFAVLYWFGLGLLALALASLSQLPLFRAAATPRAIMASALSLAAICVAGDKILLPIVHVLQSEGFYPQFWGLLPIVGSWFGYAFGRDRGERILALGAGVVFYRFTYGLNLAELIATSSLLFVAEIAPFFGKKLGPLVGAGVLVVGAIAVSMVLQALAPLLLKGGATITTDTASVALGTFLFSLALGGGALLADAARAPRRCALWAAIFGASGATLQGAALAAGQSPVYYFVKFGLHPLWISTAAAAFVLPSLLSELNSRPSMLSTSRIRLLSALTGLSLLGGILYGADGVRAYRPSYRERSQQLSSSVRLVTFFEPGAYSAVRDILAREQLAFGGYITTPNWPLSGFLNAALGHAHHFQQPYYKTGAVRAKPGNCVFWDSRPEDMAMYQLLKGGKAWTRIMGLLEEGEAPHVPYVSVLHQEPRELSYRCFPAK